MFLRCRPSPSLSRPLPVPQLVLYIVFLVRVLLSMFLILALKRDSFSILYVVLKIPVGPANVLVEMCKVDLYF